MQKNATFIAVLSSAFLLLLVVWPTPDLWSSGLFYEPLTGFWLAKTWPMIVWHEAVQMGARVFGAVCLLAALFTWWRKKTLFGLGPKPWLFLLVGLLLAPGLLANTVLKDQWDRARPHQTINFGGMQPYKPPLIPTDTCERNCSFVSGDASLGFFMHILAYVVATRWARRTFWLAVGFGGLCGLNRIAMGAHFFSDVVFAAFFMFLAVGLLHLVFFGRAATLARWKIILPHLTTKS